MNDCNNLKFYYQGGHNPQSCHYPEKGGASYKECQDRTWEANGNTHCNVCAPPRCAGY